MSLLHHPSEEILLDRAAGRLRPGPALLVDTHLLACAVCRDEAARLDALGGVLLETLEPEQIAADAVEKALARLDEPPQPPIPPIRRRARPEGVDLSEALRGLPLGRRRWLGPGMWMRPVLGQGPGRTYLLRSGPGRRLPQHGHTGEEWVLVLKGAFTDETGRYGAGDFAESDDGLSHAPITDTDGECLCLIHAARPMRIDHPLLRAVQPLLGI